ncbi:zinc finger BED domain-containing protein RICESLEEPER 2-like [Gossypium australe]|uniref:Zinc finger BED domain-containing protein RICESLEEPER 2-like n=1 Tax=Gossypium australe TaxID=47621 RepID=A0A5B6WPT1_9ROSI|nr:zinc finger BED domain-containing protein RICESLEEPER 2-like [Gossypium australe]
MFCLFLEKFRTLTTKFLGCFYVTSNFFLDHISTNVNFFLDLDLNMMTKRMKEKYKKYWEILIRQTRQCTLLLFLI